jgi:hypothetical protein
MINYFRKSSFRKPWTRNTVADVAEVAVMLFIMALTLVSTLRLLGLVA